MISLHYLINIKELSLSKNNNDNFLLSLAPIYVKNSNIHEFSSDSKYSKREISNNDLLSIKLSIKNDTADNISLLNLQFTNDKIFQFIPCSLINTNTKESYISDSKNNNFTSLSSLKKQETLNITFFLKTNFTALDGYKLNTSVRFFDYDKYAYSNNERIYLVFKQSAIKLTSLPQKNLLEIENIGTSSLADVVIHYKIPLGYNLNLSSLSATFNNQPYKITAKQIGSDLLLKLPSLPGKENNKIRKVRIFLEHKKYNLQLSDANSNISIDNK